MAEQRIVDAEQVAGYGPAGCGVVAIANGQPGQSLGIGDDGGLAWIDCCVDVTQNPDGTITIQVRDENPVVVHPPLQVTFNDGAGNIFNPVTQTLNIDFPTDVLLASSSFDPVTGVLTLTMNNGDVHQVNLSTFWPVLADGVSIIGDGTAADPLTGYRVDPGVAGTYVVTRPDGTTFSFAVHPAAALTTNQAPFSWNAATQAGNIPQVTKAALNAAGDALTITFGDGSGSVTVPVCDTCHEPATLTNHRDAFSWDVATQSGNIPQVTRASLNGAGDQLTITFGDGSGSVTVPICDECHSPAALTNNQAPFSWNAATQSGNIPQVTKAVLNADGSLTITFGDGSGSVTLPAPAASATHPAAAVTYTDAAFAWNAATQVLNVPRLNLTQDVNLANGNLPTLSADRTVLNLPPPLFARRESGALNTFVPVGAFTPILNLTTVTVDTTAGNSMTTGASFVVAPLDGWYTLHGSVGTADLVDENEVLMALLTINGAYSTRGNAQPGQINGLYNAPVATLPWHFLRAGDQVGVAAHTNKVGGLFVTSAWVGLELKRGA